MKKYYYAEGKQKFGPFSVDELLEKNINPDTLIWFEGLPDWAPLSSFPELKLKKHNQPPPLKFNENKNIKTKTNSKLIASIIFGLLVIAIGIYVYPKLEAKKKYENALDVFKKTDSISYDVFKELSKKDYPKAHYILGLYYQRINDSTSAKAMFEKAQVIDNDIPVLYELLKIGGKDTIPEYKSSFNKGFENWVNNIEKTDWLSQITAAQIYRTAGDIRGLKSYMLIGDYESNIPKAIKYSELAAENGSVMAMEYLGIRLSDEKKYDKALFWYKKAAELGYGSAMARIGDMYSEGYGVKVDHLEAKKWFYSSIKRNSVLGSSNLGYVFYFGTGVKQNLDSAKFYFEITSKNNTDVTQNAHELKESSLKTIARLEEAISDRAFVASQESGRTSASESSSSSNSFNNYVSCNYCGRGFYQRKGFVKGTGMDCATDYNEALISIRIAQDAGYDTNSLNYLLNSYDRGEWYCSKKCIYESGNCLK
jgi:tetratricopeptide (TPR) repeat protein